MESNRRSRTSPGAKPRGLLTSATRHQWTSTLPRAPRAFECQAARAAARSSTGRGSAGRLSGLRTTTWLPGTPATWSQKSRGSATPKVSVSLRASPLPTSTSKPSTVSVRYGRPSLPTPSGARAERAREVDERVAAGGDLVEAHVLLEPVQAGAARTEHDRRDPRMAEDRGVRPERGTSPLRRASLPQERRL